MAQQRTREELAWAAGLFEGEGCFSHWKSKDRGEKVYAHSTISSTDEDVILRFRSLIGFGNVTGPHRKGTYKPSWKWQTGSFEHNQATVALLWCWLGKRRKSKAIEMLTVWKNCGRRYNSPRKDGKAHGTF